MLSFLIILLLFVYVVYDFVNDKKWVKKWENKHFNFPFYHKGKEFWFSRSVAVTMFTLCKNKSDEWCVLANKRGKGTPDFQGLWNIVCGYLDFNECGEEAARRETKEETDVDIPIDKIKFLGVNTSPQANRQNVSLRYYTILDGNINDYVLSNENSEEDEVSEIKWIKLTDVDKYDWAFNHDTLIKEMADKILVTK